MSPDGHVDDALEQRGFGAEPDIDRASADSGPPRDRLQRGGHIAVREEQRGGAVTMRSLLRDLASRSAAGVPG